MKGIWKVLIPTFALAIISWAAWNTLATTSAIGRPEYDKHIEKFDEHKKTDSDKFMEVLKEIQKQREKIEEKLDKIQEKL